MNILFVCKYNRFRSRVAKNYFDKINNNKNIKTNGAGLIIGNPVSIYEKKVAKKAGVDISGSAKPLSSRLIMKQDLIVIVADNVPESVFDNKKYKAKIMDWNLRDVYVNDEKKLISLINRIKRNVEKLVKKLEAAK